MSIPNLTSLHFNFLFWKLCIIHCFHIHMYKTIYHIPKLYLKTSVCWKPGSNNFLFNESYQFLKHIYKQTHRICELYNVNVKVILESLYGSVFSCIIFIFWRPFFSGRFKWNFLIWGKMEYTKFLAQCLRRLFKIALSF